MLCSSCRHDLAHDARFCPACGAPRAAARTGGTAAGRKIVTVLFCDLVGSTALSGVLDPETLRSVTLRYFDVMRTQVELQGGTLEKFIGDAVMAVFGVPTVREDDARRALAAALGMLDALQRLNSELETTPGVRLKARIGVNTGQVVTGADTDARQALVSGEVVNIAARLEQNAGTDEILIGADTLAAAGPGVTVQDVGPLHLKGKTEAVTAYRLLGLGDDAPEALRRFDLPFIGRESELQELDAAFALAAAERRGRLVAVCGEAGQGKTRLVREWLDDHRYRAGDAPLHGTGRCRPRGEQASLQPLADAVTALLEAVGEPLRLPALDTLAEGLLLDGTPNPSLSETCAALVELLGRLGERAPVVLVLDDCHWAAPTLIDVVHRVHRALPGAPVLFVLLGRHELIDLRPGLAADAIMLNGLTDQESLRFADQLAEVTAHGDTVPANLLERAGGNPLHLEQLLVACGEAGAQDIPLSLQALIGSRIDALEPLERHALDLACVLGREFEADDLDRLHQLDTHGDDNSDGTEEPNAFPGPWSPAVLRTALARLGRLRLVSPDEHPLRFVGGLVQEVAYGCLSKRARAERHERAARLPSVRGRGTAVSGSHLEQAHRYRVELGLQGARTETLRRQAADALAEAGARAVDRTDPTWASDLLTRALDLYRPGEPARTPAARRLGEVLFALGRGDEGAALLAEVAATATGAATGTATEANPVEAAHARLGLAALGRRRSPAAVAAEALPVFEQAGDELGQARACLRLAQREQVQGQYLAADTLLVRALDHAVRAGGQQELASTLGAMAVSLWRGPEPVPDAAARCRALLAEHGRGRQAVRVTLNGPLAVLMALQDDGEAAAACLAEAEQTSERLGYAEAAVFLPLFSAAVASLLDRRRDALRLLEQAAAAAHGLGGSALSSSIHLDAARLHLDLGEWSAAGAELARLEEPSPESDGRDRQDTAHPYETSAELDGLRGRLSAALGHGAEGARLAARAVATAGRTDSPIVQGLALLDQARTALLLGRPRESARASAAARERFAVKGHRPGVRIADLVANQARAGSTQFGSTCSERE